MSSNSGRSSVESVLTVDPLAYVIRPSPVECPKERSIRLQREAEAKAISDTIDEELQKQAMAERKAPKAIKILLLGQSESGKSTTLKNFQLLYEPKAFRAERASWRAIIQLNIVRSIHLILEAIDGMVVLDPTFSPLSPDLLKLKMRLLPLRQVEEILLRRLALTGSAGGMEAVQLSYTERGRAFLTEMGVNAAVKWKETFSRGRDRESANSEDAIDWDNPEDPGVVLHACAEDMMRLWNDGFVRKLLERQGLRLEEVAGFFLDSLERVTSLRYIPTNDDILRARIKTLGVTEHRFRIKSGTSQRDWRVYDVGGNRSQVDLFAILTQCRIHYTHREVCEQYTPYLNLNVKPRDGVAAWVPYFDDMDVIIFLAPISCFDQVLPEDPTVNRLEDSVNLWKSLVSNKLLKNTNLILFLNKIDIVKEKLKAGIKLADFVISYGSKPNDYEHVSGYLQRKFARILSEHSPVQRVFYCHFTTVTDTKSTKIILYSLKDMVLRQHLMQTSLIP